MKGFYVCLIVQKYSNYRIILHAINGCMFIPSFSTQQHYFSKDINWDFHSTGRL